MSKKTFLYIAFIAFLVVVAWLFVARNAGASYELCEDWYQCEYEPSITPECDQDQCEPTATPSAEPTVEPTGEPSKGGDGLSDGKSSCPECTQAPKVVVPLASPNTGRAR